MKFLHADDKGISFKQDDGTIIFATLDELEELITAKGYRKATFQFENGKYKECPTQ